MPTRQRHAPAGRIAGRASVRGLRRSAIALGTAALLGGNAYAQQSVPDADPETGGATELDAVVVTGVRSSVTQAQAIKQNAAQIVDSIVAEDIGKLPDDSVAEALQRVTGVQISRDTKDAGNGIAIRGLTQVRTELNGRDIFTANNGRGLSWDDMPAELMAGVDVYKNPSAEIIEGGLGGTVNLRTRMPFDFDGQRIAGSATYNRYDLVDQGDKAFSGLYSNRWNTGIGEIGLMVNLSYQDGTFRQDSISIEPFWQQDEGLIPRGAGIATVFGDRARKGSAFALQWNPNDAIETYVQVLRSDYDFKYQDFSYFVVTGDEEINPIAVEFNDRGEFTNGSFADAYTESISSVATRKSVTTDYAVGARWFVNDKLQLSTDFQYIKAKTDGLRYIVATSLNDDGAPIFNLDLRGRLPTMSITGLDGDPGYVGDPANYGWAWHLDNIDRNDGDQFAWRSDLEYLFDEGLIRSFRGGVRTTDREAVNRGNLWRWEGIFAPFSAYPDAEWQVNPYNDFYRGKAKAFGPTIAPSSDMVGDYEATRDMFGLEPLVFGPNNINTQKEKTYAAYGMLAFGRDDGALPFDGNVGVRVVRTQVQSLGVMTDPDGSGELLPVDVDNSYTEALPSLNLRFFLRDNLYWRIAASRALTRPSLDRLSPNLNLNTQRDDAGNLTDPTGSAGNPNLGPMTANQFDTALEWYFGQGSMLYTTLFYKKVKGFFADGVFDETYDGNVYQVTRPVNGDEGTIKGIEVGYTQFFDFLPAPFDGLGIQANYTYVDSEAPSPTAVDTDGTPLITPLEGLSKHSYNAILMYEKGRFSARVAYNWRDDWLITTQGNGTDQLPVYNKPLGWLDASFRFNINDVWSISLDGQNLLDSEHKTYMLNQSRPRDFRINDRRYGVTLRASL